jgi:hypothetical protein
MTDHQARQLALLQGVFPDLEVREDLVVLRAYPVPARVWRTPSVEACFRLPPEPAIPPYGFWVRPGLIAADDVTPADHYQCAQAPFGENADWGFFSWSPTAWSPEDDILVFVRSFADRLGQR